MILALVLLCACAAGSPAGGGQDAAVSPETDAPTAPPGPEEPPGDASPGVPDGIPGLAVISFDYKKQSGYASNQFAVWIEDMDGHFIKTLYATNYTAKGGYKNRPDSIALWVEKSGLASMDKPDAAAGATPKAGTLSYEWDLTSADGGAVAPGEYRFFVEGSLRWKNRVIYSGVIKTGGGAAEITAGAEFIREASDGQPALTDGSPENAMIGAVTASFTPGG